MKKYLVVVGFGKYDGKQTFEKMKEQVASMQDERIPIPIYDDVEDALEDLKEDGAGQGDEAFIISSDNIFIADEEGAYDERLIGWLRDGGY